MGSKRVSKLSNMRVGLIVVAVFCGWLTITDGQELALKGRLPPYYGEIVTETQRLQIYAIQEKFEKEIKSLEAQLEGLKNKRAAEIERVLTSDQKTKLKKIQEAASANRKKKADAK
jgi:hypothetical protein